MTPWGYHLLLNCTECTQTYNNSSAIINFVDNLILDIGMKKFGTTQLYYMEQGSNSGWSFTQIITTSNVCGHFVDKDGKGFIDIFSCKKFDVDTAIQTVRHHIKPKEIHHEFIIRSA